jgi:transcriptional regulator with XRE-family HTH domain
VNNIREIRLEKELEYLAKITGLSVGYICHLEKGERKNPSYNVMYKISNALEKSISEVFEESPH